MHQRGSLFAVAPIPSSTLFLSLSPVAALARSAHCNVFLPGERSSFLPQEDGSPLHLLLQHFFFLKFLPLSILLGGTFLLPYFPSSPPRKYPRHAGSFPSRAGWNDSANTWKLTFSREKVSISLHSDGVISLDMSHACSVRGMQKEGTRAVLIALS